MKPEELYQDLKEIAGKLGITVIEKSFRNTGIQVQSGLCKVRGDVLFIMDKNIPVSEKNMVLGTSLAHMPLEEIYMVPMLREFIHKRKRAVIGAESKKQRKIPH